jgi:hypothetical protein
MVGGLDRQTSGDVQAERENVSEIDNAHTTEGEITKAGTTDDATTPREIRRIHGDGRNDGRE